MDSREFDPCRIQPLGRLVSRRAVCQLIVVQLYAADPYGPGRRCRFARRKVIIRRGLLCGRRVRCQPGVASTVELDVRHLDLLASQPDAAAIHTPFGQSDGQLRAVALHGKAGLADREPIHRDFPPERSRRVGLFDLFAGARSEPYRGAVQRNPSDRGPLLAQGCPGLFHPETCGRDPHVETRRGVAVTGLQPFDGQIAQHGLAADQRPGIHIQRQPAAVDQRVTPVDEPHISHRKPQRKAEPQTPHREFHAKCLRERSHGFAPCEILHPRYIEQPDDDEQRRHHGQQTPSRIFEELSHDQHAPGGILLQGTKSGRLIHRPPVKKRL